MFDVEGGAEECYVEGWMSLRNELGQGQKWIEMAISHERGHDDVLV